jgi:hypothetical protein
VGLTLAANRSSLGIETSPACELPSFRLPGQFLSLRFHRCLPLTPRPPALAIPGPGLPVPVHRLGQLAHEAGAVRLAVVAAVGLGDTAAVNLACRGALFAACGVPRVRCRRRRTARRPGWWVWPGHRHAGREGVRVLANRRLWPWWIRAGSGRCAGIRRQPRCRCWAGYSSCWPSRCAPRRCRSARCPCRGCPARLAARLLGGAVAGAMSWLARPDMATSPPLRMA